MNYSTFVLTIALFYTPIVGFSQKMAVEKPRVASKSVSAKKPVAKKKAYVPSPRIKFETELISFGTIKEDSVVVKKFAFTNVGEKDLVIIDVSVTCGCTFPTFPIQPIPPKGTGVIEVKYTAKNKFGPQKPVITVITNSEPRVKKLILDGWVEQIPGGVKD